MKIPEEKFCPRCGNTLSVSLFHKCSSTKDGLQRACSSCLGQYRSALKQVRKERTSVCPPSSATCGRCKKTKTASEFGVCRTSGTGLSPVCKSCASEKNRDQHLKRKTNDSVKYRLGCMVQHARARARALNVPFDIDLEYMLLNFSIAVCPILRVPLEWSADDTASQWSPSLDKIVPSKGYVKGNVQVVSFKANAMKRDATISELKAFGDWALAYHGMMNIAAMYADDVPA